MPGDFDDLGRFTDVALLVLLSLASGAKHGYAMTMDIAAFSGTTLEPGTLYGALVRLERQGWIAPLPAEERRRPYQLTEVGAVVLHQRLATLRRIVATGEHRTALA